MRTFAKLLPALLLAAGTGCTLQPPESSTGELDRTPRYETVQPEPRSREMTVDLLATVEPLEKADLCAQVPGEVKGLKPEIDIGKVIGKGDALLTLDVPTLDAELENKKASLLQAENRRDLARQTQQVAVQEVEEAKALVIRYKADLDFRELALTRVKELARRDAVQPQIQEEAELQRGSAQAALVAARAAVKTKEAKEKAAELEYKVAESRVKVAAADLKMTAAKVKFATVRAPFPGVITKRWVDNGAVIKDPGAPLFTVMRVDKVRVLIDIPERYVPLIRAVNDESSALKANLVRMDVQGIRVAGRITRQAKSLDNATRLLRAEIHVQNNGAVNIRPGMTGTATVVLDEGQQLLLNIPSTALVRVGNAIWVYYVDGLEEGKPGRGKVKMARVRIGLDDGKTVEVRTGLTDKMRVIAKGNVVVREGETAIAVEARRSQFE